jgi:hypothetical protein
MKPVDIPNANRRLGAPKDWDTARNGPCETLAMYDSGEFFQSAWLPDARELACLNEGAPAVLTVWGRMHPPVEVNVMPKPGYVTAEAFQALFAALRNLTFMCRTASGSTLNGDLRLLASIELAESVVGEIPADARRDKGDADAFKVDVPQAYPANVELLRACLDELEAVNAASWNAPLVDKIRKALER